MERGRAQVRSEDRLADRQGSHAGKPYREAIRDAKTGAQRWWCVEPPPAAFVDLTVQDGERLDLDGVDIVFSAMESDAARALEPRYAKAAAVISTASAFRRSSCPA